MRCSFSTISFHEAEALRSRKLDRRFVPLSQPHKIHLSGGQETTKLYSSIGTVSHHGRRVRRRSVSVAARGGGADPTPVERAISAAPYLLPLLDGIRYGRFLFLQFPIFSKLLSPLQPLISVYYSVPFASILVFFAVYLGVINNYEFPRYVRFNAMQAVLLDIILILPGLFETLFRGGPMVGAGLQIYITVYNTIFLFLLACVVYGVGSCLAGTSSKLPIVGDAADQQVR